MFLRDTWYATREQVTEFVYLHSDAVIIAILVLVVGFFAYRWLDAR